MATQKDARITMPPVLALVPKPGVGKVDWSSADAGRPSEYFSARPGQSEEGKGSPWKVR